MRTTAPTPCPALRLTLAAALAVVLVLPAVEVVCAPDTSGDYCPMMAAMAMPQSASCGGSADAESGADGQSARPPMDCCVADEAPAPLAPTAVAGSSDSLAVPTTAAPLAVGTSLASTTTPEADRAPRALPTPLYTLHSSLLS